MKKLIAFTLVIMLIVAGQGAFASSLTEDEMLTFVEQNSAYVDGSPLTKEDFLLYSNSENIELYNYDMLQHLNAEGLAIIHYDKNDENGNGDGEYYITYRGIRLGDSKEKVLSKYGTGVSGDFDANTDEHYALCVAFQTIDESIRNMVSLFSSVKGWVFYNFKNVGQIKFYFNSNGDVELITYGNSIEDFYVKTLFKEFQSVSEMYTFNINIWGKVGTWAIANKTLTRQVQTYINQHGYDCGTPDGISGEKTKAALTKFQKDHDMFPSGLIDDVLMKYLESQGWQ